MVKNSYIDEFGNVHYIKKELGRGGQGVVYNTKDGDIVIKEALKNDNIIKCEKEIKLFHYEIKSIIYKPIPNHINIAKPIALLKNKAGYIMKMLDRMLPIKELFPQELPKELTEKQKKEIEKQVPDFLKEFYEENQENKRSAFYIVHYLNTGSLRTRLDVLLKTAITLYKLQLRGFVYFDISHNNIFYKIDESQTIVYFIDIDNLKYNSEISLKDSIMTPNFEVPEVANSKEANSFFSDIYAFAILSFYLLTMKHPFDGKGLDKADDWDSDGSNEQKNRWDLPWIEDNNDDSNKGNGGLRGYLTISNELNQLFHKTFEVGKDNKYKRVSLNLWIKALAFSTIKTLKCPNCKMSYYDDKFQECPYCETKKPKRLIINSYIYKNNQKLQQNSYYYAKEIQDICEIKLPYFLFKEFDIDIDKYFARVKFRKNQVEFVFESDKKEEIYFNQKTKIYNFRKRIGIDRLKKGIYIIVQDSISRYLDIKVEQ